LFRITLIIAYCFIIEFIVLLLNHSTVKNADMNADLYMFNVRYTNFSIFFSTIMSGNLAIIAYFFITNLGFINNKSITLIILSLIYFFQLVVQLFFRIRIDNNSINFKSITKRTNFTFDEINKVETTQVFGYSYVDIFLSDGKIFTLKSWMLGYSLFIKHLERKNIK